VKAQVLGPSFQFEGQQSVTASLDYLVDVQGAITVGGRSDNATGDFYRYGIKDVTAGTVVYDNVGSSSNTSVSFGAPDTYGKVRVILLPNHYYQPYAEWYLDIAGVSGYRSISYSISAFGTMNCRGAAIGF
jgi:hypothetical protein